MKKTETLKTTLSILITLIWFWLLLFVLPAMLPGGAGWMIEW
jgi:hypothetical protein